MKLALNRRYVSRISSRDCGTIYISRSTLLHTWVIPFLVNGNGEHSYRDTIFIRKNPPVTARSGCCVTIAWSNEHLHLRFYTSCIPRMVSQNLAQFSTGARWTKSFHRSNRCACAILFIKPDRGFQIMKHKRVKRPELQIRSIEICCTIFPCGTIL